MEWSWYLGENRLPRPADSDAPGQIVPDEWWQRLVKTVPVIVVSAYTAAAAIVLSTDVNVQKALFGAVVVVGVLATVMEFVVVRGLDWNHTDGSKRVAARIQIVVGVAAFLIWSYAQADWATAFGIFQGAVAALLVILMGLIINVAEALKNRIAPA